MPVLAWKRKNIEQEGKKSGVYTFYDGKGKSIYVGHASNMRHRLWSYLNKDDFKAHPTKKILRGKIAYYSTNYAPKKDIFRLEFFRKQGKSYNYK